MKIPGASILPGAAFYLASLGATCFPIVLVRLLFPSGLSAGTEYLFWPATAVNAAGLLLLGWRFWPLIIVATFFGTYWYTHDSWHSANDAVGNGLEALTIWWLVQRFGDLAGGFATLRSVLALLLASIVAPLPSALLGVGCMLWQGRIPWSEAGAAFGVWICADGASLLLLTPFLVALFRGDWSFRPRPWETLIWLAVGSVCITWAFDAVFHFRGTNFAFVVFPFVIYAAVRFGTSETAAALVCVMASIYWSLARHSPDLQADHMAEMIWFIQALCFVLAATGLTLAALTWERRHAERKAFEESLLTLEASVRAERARLDSLRYQINPHFLFNALNSLRATLPIDAAISRGMVTEIAEYFRSTLAEPQGDTLTLREEVESVMRYLAIEKARFEENLQVSIKIEPELEDDAIPVFLLQPLVENAVRHGFETSPSPLTVEIRITKTESLLSIEVTNSGYWREQSGGGRTGVGLQNIRERLQLLYGDAADFQVSERDSQVWARIRLPASNPKEETCCVA